MIGYRLMTDFGVRWRINKGCIFPLTPPCLLQHFNNYAARSVLKKTRSHFVRWESDFDHHASSEWWHIIKDQSFSLSDLSGNTRSKVRRGLKAFKCQVASRDEIVREGYLVYSRAYSRYETHEQLYPRKEFVQAVKSLPEQTEFWSVRCTRTNDLVAFSENYIESDTCFYNTIWFEPSALKKYSSYALFFQMTRHYLEERGFDYVSDGARSLSHDTQIHDFLESKFGFRKAYSRLSVVYTPWLKVVITFAYPFRKLFSKVPFGHFQKAASLLKQEEIRRHCERRAW